MQFIVLIRLHTSPVQKQRNVTHLRQLHVEAHCQHGLGFLWNHDPAYRNGVWLAGVKCDAEQEHVKTILEKWVLTLRLGLRAVRLLETECG